MSPATSPRSVMPQILEAAVDGGLSAVSVKTMYAGIRLGGPRWELKKIKNLDGREIIVAKAPIELQAPSETDIQDLQQWVERTNPSPDEIDDLLASNTYRRRARHGRYGGEALPTRFPKRGRGCSRVTCATRKIAATRPALAADCRPFKHRARRATIRSVRTGTYIEVSSPAACLAAGSRSHARSPESSLARR